MGRSLLCSFVLLALLASQFAAPAPASSRSVDAIQRLSLFAKGQAKSSRKVTPARGEAFLELCEAAETLAKEEPARVEEFHRAVLVCAGTGSEPLNPVARAAVEELERFLLLDRGSTVERRLITILSGISSTLHERLGAVRALGPRRSRESIPGMLMAARAPEPELRHPATRALVGWSHAEVHGFFLGALEETHPTLALLTEHLDSLGGKLDEASQRKLRQTLLTLISQPGWRSAARATRLVPHLDIETAVPFLIEALSLWVARGEGGEGSRRIVHEIVEHLRGLSGRSLGAYPERWATWWQRVKDGTIQPAKDGEGVGGSRATFFGLRPVSDRVIFVLDRSGSMDQPFAFGEVTKSKMNTRYETAVEQVFQYLESSGADTRFGLVLFSDDKWRWKRKLVEAKATNLKAARRWLQSKEPQGGTYLRDGIEEAVGIDKKGRLDLKTLEADTVIVLCDGATHRGPSWVEAWIEQYNWEAQLVFHTVQIGNQGDGTLERLAEETGGEMVRVR